MTRTSDTRITGYEPLFSPAALLYDLPLSEQATATVEQSRDRDPRRARRFR